MLSIVMAHSRDLLSPEVLLAGWPDEGLPASQS